MGFYSLTLTAARLQNGIRGQRTQSERAQTGPVEPAPGTGPGGLGRREVCGRSHRGRGGRRGRFEEKKSDCGKAAVSSGELGSSQDPTGQTDCLWKLRVNVGAGGSLKLQRRPPPPPSSCVAAETVNNIESWRRTWWKEGELGDVLLDSGSGSAPAFRSPSPHTCSFNQPGSGIHLM